MTTHMPGPIGLLVTVEPATYSCCIRAVFFHGHDSAHCNKTTVGAETYTPIYSEEKPHAVVYWGMTTHMPGPIGLLVTLAGGCTMTVHLTIPLRH